MAASKRADWLIPWRLLALGNARFFGAPIPVVLHIVSVTICSCSALFSSFQAFAAGGPTGTALRAAFLSSPTWSRR